MRLANKIAFVVAGMLGAASQSHATVALGAEQHAYHVGVVRIFSGRDKTFVTFTSLPNCVGNGGYVTVSWPEANGGQVDQHRAAQILTTLLLAKAMSITMEVRYRPNLSPTGWDSCAIDSVYLD
jgi:hypothetical protein